MLLLPVFGQRPMTNATVYRIVVERHDRDERIYRLLLLSLLLLLLLSLLLVLLLLLLPQRLAQCGDRPGARQAR